METKPVVQGGDPGDGIHVPGAGPGFRERPWAALRGCKEMRADARFQRLRLRFAAIVTLAAVAFSLFPAGCGLEEDTTIEVAVLYWAKVQTAEGAPVAGRTVHLTAMRFTGDSPDGATLQTYTGETSTDGRTYLDARFLLADGQYIVLNGETFPDFDHQDQQAIYFAQARTQEQAQGGNGLASFEVTADLVD